MNKFKYSNIEKEIEVYGFDGVVKTHCRMCHGDCGVLVYTKNKKAVKIAGDPECPACPVEAIAKRKDGIVVMDYETCTGCRECLDACPYDVIAFDQGKGIAQKCNLCHHRVDNQLLPACADNVCLAHCIEFIYSEDLI